MAETIDQLKKKYKNGLTAAGLNFLIPGAGYIYCRRVFLGIIVLPFAIGVAYFSGIWGALTMWIVLVTDGFLTAGRYNKRLDEKIGQAMKICPQCAEKVLPEAKICKHCKYEFKEKE